MLTRLRLSASDTIRNLGHGAFRATALPRDSDVDHIFDGQGCVACNAIEKAETTYFFWFLAENKSEPGVMQDFADHRGFCRRHARYLAERGEGQGLVELYELTCSHALSALESMDSSTARHPRKQADGAAAHHTEDCPACLVLSEAEQHVFHVLGRALSRSDLREHYRGRMPLCFVHAQHFLARAPLDSVPCIIESADALLAAYSRDADPLSDADAVHAAEALSGRSGLVAESEPPRGIRLTVNPDPSHALQDVIRARQGCPVCHEVLRVWGERLAWLGEWKTHAPEREIEDLLPLCARHFWGSLEALPETLRTMTLSHAFRLAREQFVLAMRPQAAQARLGPMRWLRAVPAAARLERLGIAREVAATPLYCPLCRHAEIAEARTLALTLVLAGQPMFRRIYDEGSGLCSRHLVMAMARADASEAAPYLASAQREKLRLLRWELQEAARKDIWGARCEHPGTERHAWAHAMMLFAGTLSYDLDPQMRSAAPSPTKGMSSGGHQ